MGNWSERQEDRKEVKEKDKIRRETLGKFFYDLAKVAFAALVIGWIMSKDDEYGLFVLFCGIFFTIVFAVIGNKILK